MSWSKTESITAENRLESKKAGFLAGHSRSCAMAVVLAVSLGLGGCSWTFLPDTAADNKSLKLLEDDIQTGSITRTDGDGKPLNQLKNLDEEDWRRANAALAVALDPHGSTDRVVWDNPGTAVKGSFASDGPPFVRNDEVCRNFKTAVIDPEETRNLQGTACRPSGGEWNITALKPVATAGKPGRSVEAAGAKDRTALGDGEADSSGQAVKSGL